MSATAERSAHVDPDISVDDFVAEARAWFQANAAPRVTVDIAEGDRKSVV